MRIPTICERGWLRGLFAAAALATMAQSSAWAGPAEDGFSAAVRGDFERARSLWFPAAKAGDPDAAFLLGDMYERGKGVAVDRLEASRWYFLAAEKGHAEAKTRLAKLTDEAFNVIVAIPKSEPTVGTDDFKARFDADSAAIEVRFAAFKACVVRQARRLEPSGERADLVVQAALRACEPTRTVLREGAPSIGRLGDLMMSGYDNEARQDANLAVVEARAKRAASRRPG